MLCITAHCAIFLAVFVSAVFCFCDQTKTWLKNLVFWAVLWVCVCVCVLLLLQLMIALIVFYVNLAVAHDHGWFGNVCLPLWNILKCVFFVARLIFFCRSLTKCFRSIGILCQEKQKH